MALACTVRDCGRPLSRRDRAWACSAGHTFDVARSGYVSLLQPQDRKSTSPGDSKASVDARARLLAQGVGRALVDDIVRRAASAAALSSSKPAVVVDLGCGSGDVLGALAAVQPIDAIGIDLSTAAADRAARRFPASTWVIANADRRLPLVDRSVAIVLSVNGRRNPSECARVLRPGGMLLAAVPAPDDLIELRERVQGEAIARDRANAFLEEHAPLFVLSERSIVRQRVLLDADALRDLLRATYRGERRSAGERTEALTEMDVTVASEVLSFRSFPAQ